MEAAALVFLGLVSLAVVAAYLSKYARKCRTCRYGLYVDLKIQQGVYPCSVCRGGDRWETR